MVNAAPGNLPFKFQEVFNLTTLGLTPALFKPGNLSFESQKYISVKDGSVSTIHILTPYSLVSKYALSTRRKTSRSNVKKCPPTPCSCIASRTTSPCVSSRVPRLSSRCTTLTLPARNSASLLYPSRSCTGGGFPLPSSLVSVKKVSITQISRLAARPRRSSKEMSR